jgi:hypothetical protein
MLRLQRVKYSETCCRRGKIETRLRGNKYCDNTNNKFIYLGPLRCGTLGTRSKPDVGIFLTMGSQSASCPVGTGDPFPEAKARPVRDADHSPPSNAEVENE